MICVFTDACEEFWAGVVTQAHENQTNNDIEKQQHEPAAILREKFTRAQKLDDLRERGISHCTDLGQV